MPPKSKSDLSYKNVALFLIILVCLDTVAVAIVIIQIIPRLTKLGGSPLTSGIIASLYGAAQLFSSPFMGNLGDKTNRKNLLITCILICAVNYYLLGLPSLITFSISRLITGAMKHSQLLSMAYLTDIVPPEEKPSYFGFYGAGIGMGFIIGPIISGFLAELPDGFSWMCTVCSAMFVFNALLVWLLLPDTGIKNKNNEDHEKKVTYSKGIMGQLEKLGIEKCWDVLLLQGLLEFALMVSFTNFPLLLEEEYQLQPKNIGMFIAFLSIMGTLISLVAGKLAEFTGETAVPYLVGIGFFSFFGLSFNPNFTLYCVIISVLNLSVSLLRSWWPNMAISRSGDEKSGAVIGALHSQMAVAGMLAPIATGISTELFKSVHGPDYAGTLIGLSAFVCCHWYPKPLPKLKIK